EPSGSARSEIVPSAGWSTRLPAGKYCFRVRALGVGDRPGQWSGFQGIEVAPLPPEKITLEDPYRFQWDPVPYADHYLVEVRDSANRRLIMEKTADPRLALQGEALQRAKKSPQIRIAVQTVVESLS